MRHIFYLCITAAALLMGCQTAQVKVPTKHRLSLNIQDDPVSLDPRKVRNLKDLTIIRQIYEGLMRLDAQGIPEKALAETVTLSDDGLTYTFKLRPSVWSNGDPLTAQDFERSWKEALNPSYGCDYAYMFFPIARGKPARLGTCPVDEVGVRALDEETLVVTLEAPTPYFLELVAFPTYCPSHHERGVSNGPFYVSKWKPQERLHLLKNSSYWDAQAVVLEEIDFSIVPDNNTEALLFEKNELDWLGQPLSSSIATDLLAGLKRTKQLASYPVAGTFWLKFNTEKPPFQNNNIRKALSYAINREELITHILQGNQAPATTPLPPTMALSLIPHFQDGNKQGAIALFEMGLAEEGYNRNTLPEIVLSYSKSERNEKIVQQVQQEWERTFGISLRLEGLENHVYRKKTRVGEYQVGTGDWIGDFNDPIAFLELFSDACEINDTRWKSERFSRLLALSGIEKDPAQRKQLLAEAEQILVEAMPIAPLYHYAFDYFKKEHVAGVVLSPLGIADFKRAFTQM